MASLQIEGDLEGASERQLQFVRDVLNKRGYINNKVVFEPVGEVSDNYIASVKRISIKIDDESDFKIIAKFAPQIEAVRLALNSSIVFHNEIIMYEQVLPKFASLEIAADVPENERFQYAKCYGCLTEEPHEVVLLEDLKLLNMKMFDRFKPLANEAVRLIIKNFAKLHSHSFALMRMEPDVFNKFIAPLVDPWNVMREYPDIHAYLVQLEEHALSILDDEEYKKPIRGVVSQLNSIVNTIKKADENSKHAVIIQGDTWTNNIMFKCEEDVPVDCIIIDYQMSYAANPVQDILYMIFICTDHASRSKHFHDWINYYHDELDRALSNFGMKANYVFPKDTLDADLKRYSKMFIGTSIMMYSVFYRNTEEAALIKDAIKLGNLKEAVDKLSSATLSFYKSRIIDLIDTYRYLGYI